MRAPSLDATPLPAGFLSELDTRALRDGRKQLLADLLFYSAELDQDDSDLAGGLLIVRQGTITDYASSPRPFWGLVPPDGPWTWASVLHDGASQGDVRTPSGQRVHLVKHVTDHLFKEAMACPPCNTVPGWLRWIMYRGVVAKGSGAYGGPVPLSLLDATPIGDAIDRLGTSGDGFDALFTAGGERPPTVSMEFWNDFGTRQQFGAGGSVAWSAKTWAAIAKVTWRPGKK
jgi:hypothetical protein